MVKEGYSWFVSHNPGVSKDDVSLRGSQFTSKVTMAKSKSKSKRAERPSTTSAKTKFVLTLDHKRFLNKRAEEHAAAVATQKAGIVAKAIEEFLNAFSITRKDEIKQVEKARSIPKLLCAQILTYVSGCHFLGNKGVVL